MKKRKMPPHNLEEIIPLLISHWRRFHRLPGPPDRLQTREFRSVVEGVKTLKDQAFSESGEALGDYFQKKELLGAYLLYYWVVHYLEGLSLINELPSAPERVLEVCSGPAPYSFAALQHGAGEVIATDRSLEALTEGAEIAGRHGKSLTIRRWDCLKERAPFEGKFDCIILSHALAELFPEREKGWRGKQNEFIDSLLERLTEEGTLLISDSSLLSKNRRLLSLRDHFVGEGVSVQAPCLYRGSCPALASKGGFCYAQREFEKPHLIKEIQRGAKIFLSSLKMSYLLLRRRGAAWPLEERGELYRVTSPPLDLQGKKRFYLCGSSGKRSLYTALDTLPKPLRPFETLKRGELISVEGARDDGRALELDSESSIAVVAAAGKPLKNCF